MADLRAASIVTSSASANRLVWPAMVLISFDHIADARMLRTKTRSTNPIR
jgi:hypothetical protein